MSGWLPRFRPRSYVACLAILALSSIPAVAQEAVNSTSAATDDGDSDWLTSIASYLKSTEQLARESQPSWSSPLGTTTGLLEQRLRFDVSMQQAENGTSTTVLDGGKGLDLIVDDSDEIQVASAPYDIRHSRTDKGALSGFGDWPFLRLEHRLVSSPADEDDYVVTAWLQIQSPAGITALTAHSWLWTPTIAVGKGWGDFDIQGTLGTAIPASHTATIGQQIQTNVAFQYRIMKVLWPEFEINSTYYADGQRGGLNQIYLTPGIVVGRFELAGGLMFTCGAGYQVAVAPEYRAKPLTPSYDHALLFSTRLNF